MPWGKSDRCRCRAVKLIRDLKAEPIYLAIVLKQLRCIFYSNPPNAIDSPKVWYRDTVLENLRFQTVAIIWEALGRVTAVYRRRQATVRLQNHKHGSTRLDVWSAALHLWPVEGNGSTAQPYNARWVIQTVYLYRYIGEGRELSNPTMKKV